MAVGFFSPTENTPEDISARRKFALDLLKQGMDASPVQHWSQAVARAIQGTMGGYFAKEAETEGKAEQAKAMANLLSTLQGQSGQPSTGEPPLPPPTGGPRSPSFSPVTTLPPDQPSPYKVAGMAPPVNSQDTFRTPLDAMAPREQGLAALKAGMGAPPMAGATPPGAIPVQTQAITPPRQLAQSVAGPAPPPGGVPQVPQRAPTMPPAAGGIPPGTAGVIGAMSNPWLGTGGQAIAGKILESQLKPRDQWQQYTAPDGTTLQRNATTGEVKTAGTENPAISEVNYARKNWQNLGLPDPNSTDPKTQNFWKEFTAKRMGGAGVNVTVDQSAPSEFEKEYGQGMGKRAIAVIDQGDAAATDLNRIQLTKTILSQAKTGKLAPAQATIGAWAKSVGVDPANLGIDPNLPVVSEVAQSAMAQTVVGMIGAGGFPANNFSDADRKFLQSIPGGLANQPGSNELLSDIAERVAQRKLDKANAWADARENKTSYEQFERNWRQKISKEDMFADVRGRIQGMEGGNVPALPQSGPIKPGHYQWKPK